MTENLCISMTINPTNTFLVNREAHTALQLLHRRSSDEDDEDEEEDTEEGEQEIEKNKEEDTEEAEQEIDEIKEDTEEGEEEIEEIKEENGDDTLVAGFNNNHVNHSKSPPNYSSSLSFPFPVGFGRGSRPISMVTLFNCFFVFLK
jgi:hypothetical protein